MKRYEVKVRPDGRFVQVNENHINPDDGAAGAGKVVTFPAFSMSIEDAQELLIDLGEALVEAQGFVEFTRISEDELEFRQADDSIGGGITG